MNPAKTYPMQKDVLVQFCSALVDCVSSVAQRHKTYENPSFPFVRKVKAGEYDKMPDHEYYIDLGNIDVLSKFWGTDQNRAAWDVFEEFLNWCVLTDESRYRIAGILAEAFAGSHPDLVQSEGGYPLVVPCLTIPENAALSAADSISGEMGGSHSGAASSSCSVFDTVKEDAGLLPSAVSIYENPQNIYKWLKDRIYGQDDAVQAASMLLWNHLHKRKTNLIFIGPTGCGKTEIFRQLNKLYKHIIFIDGSRLTQDGWSGTYKIGNILGRMDPDEVARSIIVIDEADKMFEPQHSSFGDNVSYGVQNEILRMLDGDGIQLQPKKGGPIIDIATEHISFVFLGAFERLVEMKDDRAKAESRGIGFGSRSEQMKSVDYSSVFSQEDLVKYAGVRREIAGRIGTIVQLAPMNAEGFYQILERPQMSPLTQLAHRYGVIINMDEDTRRKLAEEACESRMGVRYMRSRIQKLLDEKIFEDCERESYDLAERGES